MKYKTIIFYTLTISVLLGVSYSKINLQIKYNSLNIAYASLLKNLSERGEYTGRFIWEILGIEKDDYKEFERNNNIISEHFFIIVDSIDCYSCYKFHEKKLNEFSDIFMTFYSPNNSKLVKANFKSAIEYSNKQIKNIDNNLLKKNIVVCLVNEDGKVVYIDIADKTNYDKSRVFYQIVASYINKNQAE